MAHRSRILAFGSAATVAIVGGICGAAVPGLTGQLLALVLVSLGLGAIVLLLFYEVGLSEDKDRAAEHARRQEPPARAAEAHPKPRLRSRTARRLRE